MTIDALLNRLDKPRQTGPGRWLARCPAHDDRSPSLSIRTINDGFVLVHCFGGCGTADVLAAVNLDFSDLYPPRPVAGPATGPERRPFPALDVLKALAFETTIVLCAAADLLQAGDSVLGPDGFARLALAHERIQTALSLAEGRSRHG